MGREQLGCKVIVCKAYKMCIFPVFCQECSGEMHRKGKLRQHQPRPLTENQPDKTIEPEPNADGVPLSPAPPPPPPPPPPPSSTLTQSPPSKRTRLSDSFVDSDKDREYFKQRLHKIIKDGQLESSLFSLVEKGSELFVHCEACDKLIATGDRHRALGSFARHLDLPTHKTKYSKKMDALARKQLGINEESAKLDQKIHQEKEKKLWSEALQKKADGVNLKHGDCFTLLLNVNALMCKYCMKRISLDGAYEHNASEHVKSPDHLANKARQKPQASIKSYFTKPL